MKNEKALKYETLRRHGTEILRVCISLSDFSELPDKIGDFYSRVAEEAKNGALKTLGEIAESAFDDMSRGRSFFKRYNYLFECHVAEIENDVLKIEIRISVSQGGTVIFAKNITHFWSISDQVIIPKIKHRKTSKNKKDSLLKNEQL